MNKIQRLILATVFVAMPSFALATETIPDMITTVGTLVGATVPVLMGLGLIYFLWGVIQYIRSASDETKKVDAKKIIIRGLIGLFSMVAVWGLVEVIRATLGVDASKTYSAPQIP